VVTGTEVDAIVQDLLYKLIDINQIDHEMIITLAVVAMSLIVAAEDHLHTRL